MSKLVLICFDMSDKNRLRKISNLLLNYGKRVQHSIFECHIKNKDLKNLTQKIQEIIDLDFDKINIYVLCAKDERKIQVYGKKYVTQDKNHYII